MFPIVDSAVEQYYSLWTTGAAGPVLSISGEYVTSVGNEQKKQSNLLKFWYLELEANLQITQFIPFISQMREFLPKI